MKASKKPSLEWHQNETSITINLPISNVSFKKLDFFLTDAFLKINILEKNMIKFLDFHSEIDFASKSNNFLYINETLEITLQKKQQGLWSTLLIENLSKEAVIKRREEAILRKTEAESQFQKNLNDIKIKYDRHSVSEQMKIEQKEREFIENKKKQEKEAALKDLYSSIDEGSSVIKKTVKKNDIFDENEINEYLVKIIPNQSDSHPKAEKNEIFDKIEEETIEEVREIPEPRSQKSIQLKFTEKVYPHLAAREQHLKDPPFPKIKTATGVSNDSGSDKNDESNNPLWLKDKGDEFYRNKDYYSAINAYNSAFKKNEKFIECIANRSACHLNLFNYRECIKDCNEILGYLEKLPETEYEGYKLMEFKLKARKAVALTWEGSSIEQPETIFKELIDNSINEDLHNQINKAHETFKTRVESITFKKAGDIEFKKANYQRAIEKYIKSLEIDPSNEIVLGNLSLCLYRLEDYQKSLEILNKTLDLISGRVAINQMNLNMKQSSQEAKPYIIKLLMRKIEILRKIDKLEENSEIINEILRLDENNKEAQIFLKEIEEIKSMKEAQKLKAEAAESVKNEDFLTALNIYNDALKKITQKNVEGVLEYLAVLLNKSICHLKLEQYDDIINIGIRGLKLIKSMKNRVLAFENNKMTKEQKIKLNNFEIRFLIRRSNAYLKQNQIFNAKSDLEEALMLDPENKEIREELEKIRTITI